jgi:hypothetical protein
MRDAVEGRNGKKSRGRDLLTEEDNGLAVAIFTGKRRFTPTN